MIKVISFLWFAESAREAVEFYVSLVPNSSIGETTIVPSETPSGPPGSVEIVEFTLGGQNYIAMQAGPFEPFNHAFSVQVVCEDQAELDRIWDGFLANGGTAEHCGWLRDRWGLSWQIVPKALAEMMSGRRKGNAKKMTEAMLQMVKIDVSVLEKAFQQAT
ncbi:VOC family protein [Rhizobium mesosinicum]|uniref:VOC family protein n=1 Tax=Rhizobium mesosinicum TaxID=335017 RepID=A0ABS7H0J4_9HYPH|nr:VOC family protein [Rhizobium mesosinicum]MBW9055377.1 VOC family protein [Rhizobium mesosinicum]